MQRKIEVCRKCKEFSIQVWKTTVFEESSEEEERFGCKNFELIWKDKKRYEEIDVEIDCPYILEHLVI